MADRNMSSGFSLDDILSETEKDTEKVPGKLWSLSEIDALLADEGLSEPENLYIVFHGLQLESRKSRRNTQRKNMSQPKKKTARHRFHTHQKKSPTKSRTTVFR